MSLWLADSSQSHFTGIIVRMAMYRDRIRGDGKFFRLGAAKWMPRGVTYGPFAPNCDGHYLPSRPRVGADFAQIQRLGCNALRVYHIPPRWVLDEALGHELRMFIDVPWDKHRCFFEDQATMQDARRRVAKAARLAGDHPATFAISVANEIPGDIVRYYGRRRVERFIDELIDIVKEISPDCLATYTNFPTTEYLAPRRPDFCCFNLFLEDREQFASYLARLHHIAGPLPLMLGEIGLDSRRGGEDAQARLLCQFTQIAGRQSVGAFIFSFTDDWFTAGQQIQNWSFGITDKERRPKPAARVFLEQIKEEHQLRISVIVCSYNSVVTLKECLESLVCQNYSDFEVLLIDDGSIDNTREIVLRFPRIKYFHQENQGLSVARNVGLRHASGEIVAYTDADCFAHEDWLANLATAFEDESFDAIGGPNLPPINDPPLAKFIAKCPGGPTHVMLDDRCAEHIPGCNMAFRRRVLLDIGGFDPRFRQAGDDVDICWRMLDAGKKIGFAPTAQIWHHRRSTIRAYLKQQAGYGRAEALLHQKHPHRFTNFGCANWSGVIYGQSSSENRVAVHYGQFGSALFQMIYRKPGQNAWTLALRQAHPLIFMLHLLQPAVRTWARLMQRLFTLLPRVAVDERHASHIRRISRHRCDLYWTSNENRSRGDLLRALEQEAARVKIEANFRGDFEIWDALIRGGVLHKVQLHTATEYLGSNKTLTRARLTLHPTRLWLIVLFISVVTEMLWPTIAGGAVIFLLLGVYFFSQRSVLSTMARLVHRAGNRAKLDPVLAEDERTSFPLPLREGQGEGA